MEVGGRFSSDRDDDRRPWDIDEGWRCRQTQSMMEVLKEFNLPTGSVALGSVKSNIGHLKSAAGAARLLKAALALHHRVLPPSVNCERTNPDIDFAHSPLLINRELRSWDVAKD